MICEDVRDMLFDIVAPYRISWTVDRKLHPNLSHSVVIWFYYATKEHAPYRDGLIWKCHSSLVTRRGHLNAVKVDSMASIFF